MKFLFSCPPGKSVYINKSQRINNNLENCNNWNIIPNAFLVLNAFINGF